MKLILFSDLHAHPFKDFARTLPNGRNSRLENALTVLRKVREFAVKNHIYHVIFGGDLFHKKSTLSVSLYQAVYEEIALFAEEEVQLHLVVGNHDQATLAGDIHAVKAFSNVAEVYDKPTTVPLLVPVKKWTPPGSSGRVDVRFVPYMEDTDAFKEALRPTGGDPKLLVAHGAINGAVTGPVEYQPEHELEVGDLPKGYDFKFFGHYHRRQKMAEKCWYIGSPMQHTRGEAGEKDKGFLVYDSDTLKFKNHPLHLPEFVQLSLGQKPSAEDVKGQFVEVEFDPEETTPEEVLTRITKLGAESVVPVPIIKDKVAEQRLDVKPSMSPRRLVESYVDEYAEEDQDELKRLALHYLEGV